MISPSKNYCVSKVGQNGYYKEYYRLNRVSECERLNNYRTTDTICDCGDTIKIGSVITHTKSNRHRDNIKYKNDTTVAELKEKSIQAYSNGNMPEYQRFARKLREYKKSI